MLTKRALHRDDHGSPQSPVARDQDGDPPPRRAAIPDPLPRDGRLPRAKTALRHDEPYPGAVAHDRHACPCPLSRQAPAEVAMRPPQLVAPEHGLQIAELACVLSGCHQFAPSRWLFPGRVSARPVTALAVTRQLKQHGIHLRAERTAALADLAGQLPPAVLASPARPAPGRRRPVEPPRRQQLERLPARTCCQRSAA